jgi:hypothetical protein
MRRSIKPGYNSKVEKELIEHIILLTCDELKAMKLALIKQKNIHGLMLVEEEQERRTPKLSA